MNAVAYQNSKADLNEDTLLDIELDKPVAAGRDCLIKVKEIAVNPVD